MYAIQSEYDYMKTYLPKKYNEGKKERGGRYEKRRKRTMFYGD